MHHTSLRLLQCKLIKYLCRYDEIEGEVNLCFDQLIFRLSEAMFAHYKERAAL